MAIRGDALESLSQLHLAALEHLPMKIAKLERTLRIGVRPRPRPQSCLVVVDHAHADVLWWQAE